MTAQPIAAPQDWEVRELARLEANRCPDPECRALPPNHLTGCTRQRLPDPDAERHDCGFVLGTYGCRREHRRET
jgi:hypothetical protein